MIMCYIMSGNSFQNKAEAHAFIMVVASLLGSDDGINRGADL